MRKKIDRLMTKHEIRLGGRWGGNWEGEGVGGKGRKNKSRTRTKSVDSRRGRDRNLALSECKINVSGRKEKRINVSGR
jgi:hypothetical protein